MRKWEYCLLAIALGTFLCVLHRAAQADARRGFLRAQEIETKAPAESPATQEAKIIPGQPLEVVVKMLTKRVMVLENRVTDLEDFVDNLKGE